MTRVTDIARDIRGDDMFILANAAGTPKYVPGYIIKRYGSIGQFQADSAFWANAPDGVKVIIAGHTLIRQAGANVLSWSPDWVPDPSMRTLSSDVELWALDGTTDDGMRLQNLVQYGLEQGFPEIEINGLGSQVNGGPAVPLIVRDMCMHWKRPGAVDANGFAPEVWDARIGGELTARCAGTIPEDADGWQYPLLLESFRGMWDLEFYMESINQSNWGNFRADYLMRSRNCGRMSGGANGRIRGRAYRVAVALITDTGAIGAPEDPDYVPGDGQQNSLSRWPDIFVNDVGARPGGTGSPTTTVTSAVNNLAATHLNQTSTLGVASVVAKACWPGTTIMLDHPNEGQHQYLVEAVTGDENGGTLTLAQHLREIPAVGDTVHFVCGGSVALGDISALGSTADGNDANAIIFGTIQGNRVTRPFIFGGKYSVTFQNIHLEHAWDSGLLGVTRTNNLNGLLVLNSTVTGPSAFPAKGYAVATRNANGIVDITGHAKGLPDALWQPLGHADNPSYRPTHSRFKGFTFHPLMDEYHAAQIEDQANPGNPIVSTGDDLAATQAKVDTLFAVTFDRLNRGA